MRSSGTFALGADPEAAYMAPATGTDRVSLVHLGPDAPLFERVGGAVRTLVAVWPTDAAGHLVPKDVNAVRVLWWAVSPADLARLTEIHALFPLDRCDVLIEANRIRPCRESFYQRARASHHRSAHLVDNAVRDLVSPPLALAS